MQETRFVAACEKEGWKVSECDKIFELSKYSPLGEDFSFTVERKNPVKGLEDYYDSFDPEEHAAMWIQAKMQKGNPAQVPGSLEDLCHDADAIEDMICDLYAAVREAMTVKVKIYNIRYETDGQRVKGLPKTMELEVDMQEEEIESEFDLEEYLRNYISDTTGWLHNGFSWKLMEG